MLFSYDTKSVYILFWVYVYVVPVHEHTTEILLNCYLNVYLDTRYMALECIKILTGNFRNAYNNIVALLCLFVGMFDLGKILLTRFPTSYAWCSKYAALI